MKTETLHTMETLEENLHENGFMAILPGKGDVLGDSWSREIGELFERTADAEGMFPDVERHHVWLVWQSLYCTLTRMESRIVARPQAMEMAGIDVTDAMKSEAIRLLIASQSYLD